MKARVLDSWPILEWINGRSPPVDIVAGLLEEAASGHARLFVSAINVGEVYYFLRKNNDVKPAEDWRELSPTLPVVIETPALDDIWAAALLKSRYPISYADAFAAALALKHGCQLVTGDPDFRDVESLDLDWMGRDSNAN